MKTKKYYQFYWILVTVALCLMNVRVNAEPIICRLSEISGYEKLSKRAKAVLPAETKDINEAAVYIERDPSGNYYFYSNFITPGYDYPTKIGGGGGITDVPSVFPYLLWKPDAVDGKRDEGKQIYENKVKIIVDQTVFDEHGKTELDFGKRESFFVIGQNQKLLEARTLHTKEGPPPAWIVQPKGCCLSVKLPARADEIYQRLEQIPFDKNELSLLSLVAESGTRNAIKKQGLNNIAMEINPKTSQEAEEIIESEMKKYRGKTFVVLGHVEDGRYVIRYPEQKEPSISIERIRQMAQNNDVQLIELGCNTAKEISQAGESAVGVANLFNTVKAVQQLAQAMELSQNHAEFLLSFSSQELPLVVGRDVLKTKTQIQVSVYTGANTSEEPFKELGRITITLNRIGFYNFNLNGGEEQDQEDEIVRIRRSYEELARLFQEYKLEQRLERLKREDKVFIQLILDSFFSIEEKIQFLDKFLQEIGSLPVEIKTLLKTATTSEEKRNILKSFLNGNYNFNL